MKLLTKEHTTRALTKDEFKVYSKIATTLATLAVIFMVVFLVLVNRGAFKLYPSSSGPETLTNFGAKAEFAFRYQSLLAFWLLFNILVTIYGRVIHSALENPLVGDTSGHLNIYKYTLTNSFEQILLSILSQMVFITFASPAAIVKFIPMANIILFIGRVTFYAGYPFYRAFGFLTSMIPTIILVLYNIFMFGSFIGLY